MVQAATERAFDYSAGCPYDPNYRLRLKLILECLDRKNVAKLEEVACYQEMMITLQHTLAHADSITADPAYAAKDRLWALLDCRHKAKDRSEANDFDTVYGSLKKFYEETFGRTN